MCRIVGITISWMVRFYYVCRAVSRQMEKGNPYSKGMFPDTPLEGDYPELRERGFLRSPLQASCRVRHFPDEFQGGWSGKQVPYRHGGFRPGQRSCGEPEFQKSDLSQFPYFTKELDECSTLSDKLMYALKNMNNWNRMPDALKEQVFSHLWPPCRQGSPVWGDRIAYDKAVGQL